MTTTAKGVTEANEERAAKAIADHICEPDEWRSQLPMARAVLAALSVSSGGLAVKALRKANEAIAEYVRYLDGGEMRGSYDGKPEREALRKAGYATRAALSALAEGEKA